MFVKHLQQYLDQFTNGTKGTAVSNASIYVQVVIGNDSIRVVLKPTRNKILFAPTIPE